MRLPSLIKQYTLDVLHLFYPHVCTGCGSDAIDHGEILCSQCFAALPATDDFTYENNPVERMFAAASSCSMPAARFISPNNP